MSCFADAVRHLKHTIVCQMDTPWKIEVCICVSSSELARQGSIREGQSDPGKMWKFGRCSYTRKCIRSSHRVTGTEFLEVRESWVIPVRRDESQRVKHEGTAALRLSTTGVYSLVIFHTSSTFLHGGAMSTQVLLRFQAGRAKVA